MANIDEPGRWLNTLFKIWLHQNVRDRVVHNQPQHTTDPYEVIVRPYNYRFGKNHTWESLSEHYLEVVDLYLDMGDEKADERIEHVLFGPVTKKEFVNVFMWWHQTGECGCCAFVPERERARWQDVVDGER